MRLTSETAGERWRIRPDSLKKVTGELKYLTDLTFPAMLFGKILRSPYPHANIRSISTKKAEEVPGVVAIVTHEDVPGMNRFGLVFPDQPVLCEDRVRFVGDAIAAVAAESEEIADLALKLIQIEYEKLPIVSELDKAILGDSVKLHPNGNILHRSSYINGEAIDEAFTECSVIVEGTYETPRQMHVYMETEGGIVVPNREGGIIVYAATQHGFKDRMQLSRILNLPESMIRVVSSPIGGSFGGKDELNIQPYASLLAIKSGRPVKIHQTRSESVRAGLKRHPMKITMKTGVNQDGVILAHQVRILADTGAYASLGPAVLDFAVEHSTGPYFIPHVDVEGISVYTNNGISGEFRGFGGNQVSFALESQINRLAQKLSMSPVEIREKNMNEIQKIGPIGQRIVPTNGAVEVLRKIANSPILQTSYCESEDKQRLRGTGMAISMHGGGLGFGRPDPSGGRLSLTSEGKIEIAFGFEEMGQGLLSTIEIMMTEQLRCSKEDLEIIIGDTDFVPISGSSTASRATNMIWQGIKRMRDPWSQQLIAEASKLTGVPIEKLRVGPNGVWDIDIKNAPIITFQKIANQVEKLPTITTSYQFPTTPDATVGGHYLYTFGAVAVEVEVERLTGRVKVTKIDQAVAAGPIVNPMGYLGQIEGGGVMAVGFTLMEDSLMDDSQYVTENLDTYLIPTICDVPHSSSVEAIEALLEGDHFGPRGVGEIGTIAVAPAITAAIFQATSYQANKLPISAEEILMVLQQQNLDDMCS